MKKEVGNKEFKKWGLLGKGVRVLKTGRAVTPFQTMVNRHTCIDRLGELTTVFNAN